MPTPRTYIVSFNRAEKTDHGFRVHFDIAQTPVATTVIAATLPELETIVRKLAAEYGRTCSPYIRLKNGNSERKPAGFDRWCKTLNIIEIGA